MTPLILDTHALIWYFSEPERLSDKACECLKDAENKGLPLHLSSISIVEMIYLVEKGKMPERAFKMINKAIDEGLCVVALDNVLANAVANVARDQVPDMPDRIIAATAKHLNMPLVTRDSKIIASGIKTIW